MRLVEIVNTIQTSGALHPALPKALSAPLQLALGYLIFSPFQQH
jgi:hypothetical protein